MNPREILDGAVSAAREAGRVLLDRLGKIHDVELKGAVDLVTEADRESEALLVALLHRLLPAASILAEEGDGIDASPDLSWIVDPLDGTTNFAHGYPVFCVSIALEDSGGGLLGVVHDPTRDETFTALRGEGARLGSRRLRVSETPSVDRAVLVTGFPYDVWTTERDNLTQFRRFLKTARAVRRDGSAALDLAYVAAGRLDGFWEEGLAPWDMAAGALLVREAGGTVTGYRGEVLDLRGGNIVAANGRLHAAMVRTLSEIEDGGELPPLASRRRTR
jgi:myo-inositol-1(or 4)-monophosphatase